ncbi:type II toxin-antitoxin system death-on-curing family toxin [Lactobacillus helveticus]|uniref:type II toxin-antitoxin system death-on-curing family toxin n=1 Tax=Lactobacillus helveticus TaxID=1587 RepID=UPI001C64703B|nr:type II toxin-antitoxin system death-on-curing family toxin [Lactobacillus helveticus]MBW8009495.1 type II toxin-antitoxin system death-on-curing family toxin [Lactobacillus helveticus]MBW8019526.1 type II toxin-antitoxin system death-on-curing family toxin [Lactobacillus helveticus]MBW8044037.1 type II toxin-antitoxin system death-on-curing family toxin [Lactobacillus helveticus]MBW8053538.1 type II toxin-antitoxin system death-on-curing family toxin [Lactobacillus helveticus]
MTNYLTRSELIRLNHDIRPDVPIDQLDQLVQYEPGIDIVVVQPQQIMFGQELYPTLWIKAAFIMQKITKKHVFTNGNKRTSLTATAYFLYKNNYDLLITDEEAVDIVLFATNNDDSEEIMRKIARWLKEHSRKIEE